MRGRWRRARRPAPCPSSPARPAARRRCRRARRTCSRRRPPRCADRCRGSGAGRGGRSPGAPPPRSSGGAPAVGRDAERDPRRAPEHGVEEPPVHSTRELLAREGGARGAGEGPRVAIDVAVRLDVDRAAALAHLHRLVGALDGRADRYQREEPLDVLGVEADAAVGRLHADAPRNVRAVDAVDRAAQLEAVVAERVVGRAARDGVPSVAALRDVLAPDRLRDVPGRLHLLRLHPELAAWRAPGVAPEADGVGGDERRLWITGRGAEVVEPQLGDVDHDALVRAAGQHPLGRHHDVRADRRHPRIDAWVRVDDLVVAEVEPARDVEQRVALPDAVVADGADDRLRGRAQAVGGDRLPREGGLVPRRRRVLRADARAQRRTAGDQDGRREKCRRPLQDPYRSMTLTPTVAKRSIEASTCPASSSAMVLCTSFPGLSLPASSICSMAPKRGACMPSEPMMIASLSTIRSIGSDTSPCSAWVVRPIWRWRPRLRSELTEFRQVAAMPSASIDTCAPPRVRSRMAAAGSPLVAFTVATAPSSFAKASFSSATSTAITLAPSAVAICTAESPTPPQPCTATHSPAPTFA